MNNGDQKYPAIKVIWNPETQAVALDFDPKEFKTWNFVLALLGMGIETGKQQMKMDQVKGMMQAQAEAQHAAKIKQMLAR
jgi:hypothetical protein